jgi:hypothetical protein
MVLCRSSAWLVRPLRAAEIASLTAAISTDEVESVEATANRGPGAAAWMALVVPVVPGFDVDAAAFAPVTLALAAVLLSLEPGFASFLASFLAVSLEFVFAACLAVSFFAASFLAVSFLAVSLAPAFADGFAASLACAPSDCGFAAGSPPAESACRTNARTPADAHQQEGGNFGAQAIVSRDLIGGPAAANVTYSVDNIDEELTAAVSTIAADRGEKAAEPLNGVPS